MMSGMDWHTNQLLNLDRPKAQRVRRDAYEQWRRQQAVWDCLQNIRYGQSFCNCFDIADAFLNYCADTDRADRYIRRYYVKNRNVSTKTN